MIEDKSTATNIGQQVLPILAYTGRLNFGRFLETLSNSQSTPEYFLNTKKYGQLSANHFINSRNHRTLGHVALRL